MIIPAILVTDFEEIAKKIETAKIFAKRIHIDLIDGKFTENISFIDDLNKFVEYSGLVDLEAHLMVDEPINYLNRLSDVGFKYFMGHVERMSDQADFIARGEELGGVGLALDLDTDLENIKVSYEDLDQILLMSVRAGFSGQVFENRVIEKIRKLREKFYGKIEIDGGVNKESLVLAKEAGASNFCVTSALFKENPKAEFEMLTSLL